MAGPGIDIVRHTLTGKHVGSMSQPSCQHQTNQCQQLLNQTLKHFGLLYLWNCVSLLAVHELDYVAIADNVIFSFCTQFTGFPGGGQGTSRH